MQSREKKKYFKILFFIAVGVVFTLSVVPTDKLDFDFEYTDKVKHIIAFFTLSLLLNRASSTILHRLRNMGALLLFGIFIELAQYFTPHRTTSIDDVVADLVGIFLFQLLYSLFRWIKQKM